jgi:two-component system invasion response regulator UvrY
MIHVLIVDDHIIVQKGLQQILSAIDQIRVTGEAVSAAQALAMVRENEYDAVLLDICLPDQNGLELLKQMKASRPNLPVLILSAANEEQYAVRAIKMGASGYLHKQSAPTQLVDALYRVVSGKKYITARVAEELANSMDQRQVPETHYALSNREYETLRLIASGKKLSDIADTMSLSPKTVSVYRARMMEKMKFRSNADVVHYAINHRLIE